MAIDDRFSIARFEADHANGNAHNTADELQNEILAELHCELLPALNRIVERLSALGHHLHPYTPTTPGDVSLRDDNETDGQYQCRLRLSIDTIVSVGFRDALVDKTDSGD